MNKKNNAYLKIVGVIFRLVTNCKRHIILLDKYKKTLIEKEEYFYEYQ